MAYDTTSIPGRVRLLISDVGHGAPPQWIFDDDEILAFVEMGHGRTMLAAAIALETIASNSAMVLKVITTQDLQTDGAKLSDALLKRAATLRKQDADDVPLDPASGLDFAFAFPVAACGPELAHEYGIGWDYGVYP